MGEHENGPLVRDLGDLGRALDRPPSPSAVATIVAAALESTEKAPPRPSRARMLLVAAAVVGVLALSVHTDDMFRGPQQDMGTAQAPVVGDCATWATMDVVTRSELADGSGWSPPSELGPWTAKEYFTRRITSDKLAAMVQYTHGDDTLSVEHYPPNAVADALPMGIGDIAVVQVGPYAAEMIRPSHDRYYRVNTSVTDKNGTVERISTVCDGNRLTWTALDGSSYALSGTIPEDTMIALAENLT
ncbi:hypothetical protein [Actinokineospora globicatena]|uniref:Uncharacterized protein n=1 Tax=Actinokineospora globicatena TaxID=103729 RepID=A0A9W6V7X9_9PSEU|nr:hypothetical protein [Actinokineospora globicatena]MCP2306493.1 hypothetical protein [Actinokineospora globicatena]GLW81922.1 hypothetical protein Aglo01_64030 [Actinokineospora globicatena]GLW88716.1 hypothetical protein Aglo02_63550 [Actinokineospora globicatena]GLW89406.1 hypothetical protein Aglo03_02220 [Actinokineospora globicatena]